MNPTTTPGRNARRFIVDLSDLYGFLSRRSGIAGIQRLLLRIASHRSAWTSEDPEREVVLAHWNPILEAYVEFPLDSGIADYKALREERLFPRIDRFNREKYPAAPIARSVYRARRTLRRFYELELRGANTRKRLARLCREVEFQPGDVLLSLGSSWDAHVQQALDCAQPHIEAGHVTPIFLIHDLIPFHTGTEIHTPDKVDRFMDAFHRSTSLASRFLVYSRATELDLRRKLDGLGRTDPQIARFALAHEFICEVDASDRTDQVPDRVLSRGRDRVLDRDYVLMVGPIRGRKNGNRLWAAWQRLAEKHGLAHVPDLVFAGSGRGRDLNPLPTGEFAGRVHFARFPSDAELASLYRNARFCVFPSLHEGWGLPIGEALWHRKLCLTSASSSMPEVSGRYADYFDPRDVDSITAALERPLFDPEYLAERERLIQTAPLRTWTETTTDLFDAAHRLAST